MKFLADENLAKDLVDLLESHSHEVLWIRNSPHKGSDDETLIKLAIKENFIVLTHDRGFGQMFYFTYRGKLAIIVLEVIEPYPIESEKLLDTFLSDMTKFTHKLKKKCLILIKANKIRIIC